MIDISDKGVAYLHELDRLSRRQELSKPEKVDRQILLELRNTREPVGRAISESELDTHNIVSALIRTNPSWNWTVTKEYVIKHTKLLQPDMIEIVI